MINYHYVCELCTNVKFNIEFMYVNEITRVTRLLLSTVVHSLTFLSRKSQKYLIFLIYKKRLHNLDKVFFW